MLTEVLAELEIHWNIRDNLPTKEISSRHLSYHSKMISKCPLFRNSTVVTKVSACNACDLEPKA